MYVCIIYIHIFTDIHVYGNVFMPIADHCQPSKEKKRNTGDIVRHSLVANVQFSTSVLLGKGLIYLFICN